MQGNAQGPGYENTLIKQLTTAARNCQESSEECTVDPVLSSLSSHPAI